MSSQAQGSPEDRVGNGLEAVYRLITIAAVVLGLIALSGWFLNVPQLLTIIPPSQPMALSSAIAFVCLAVSMSNRNSRGILLVVTRSVVLLIGAAFVLSFAGPTVHFIRYFVDPIPGLFTRAQFPVRMSFISAMNFFLLGAIGISDVALRGKGGIVARQTLLVLLGFFILLSAIGLLYSIALLRSFGFEKEISIPSTACFCLLFVAELFRHPREGLMLSLLDRSVSGTVVRRILVFVFLVPILIGGFVATGNAKGFLDSMEAILLVVIVTLLSLSMLVIGQGRVILQGEKQLHESWRRYQELFEHMFNGVVVFREAKTGGQFFMQEVNESAAALLGVNRIDVLGKELLEAFPCMMETELLPALQEAQRLHQGRELPGIHCIRQGSSIWINGALYPLSTGEIVFVMDDITAQIHTMEEKKHLASQLEQSQKMEALGRLASGVAHDFNNMLTVILGYSLMLAEGLSGDDQAKAREILSVAQLAAKLTEQLLLFGRKRMMVPTLVDPGENFKMLGHCCSGLSVRMCSLQLIFPTTWAPS